MSNKTNINNDSGEITRVYSAEKDNVGKAVLRNLNPKKLVTLVDRGIKSIKQNGFEETWRKVSFRLDLMLHREVWQYRADIPLKKDLAIQRQIKFAYTPKISIVVPLFNTNAVFLKDCINSCLCQSYANLELVLADASDDENATRIKKQVKGYDDKRIVYIKLAENKGISDNTNAGISKATGDWLTLLDHDDVLQPNALFEVVKEINRSDADFVYSDEVVLNFNLKKLVMFHFKPDFSPDSLRGCNYITHLAAFSRELFEKSGGRLNSEFDGAQDYDLILRLTENANQIKHIPKALYFWRSHEQSSASGIAGTKPYALEAGRKALSAHLKRVGLNGTPSICYEHLGAFKTVYAVNKKPRVSVIIPNKDHIDDLERAVDSLLENSGWDNLEIIIVENNSVDEKTFEYYEILQKDHKNIKVVTYKNDFNFSAINNYAVEFSTGEYLLLLNNDVKIISADFVKEMLSYAQRSDVGAVGAKLLYEDGTLQHAGVIVGINGTAGHSHKGHPGDSGGDMYRLATAQNYLAVTGACLMVKKSLYQQFNGLDEKRFGVAFNDVDFCLRMWRKGYVNVFTPFAVAYHYESKSRGYDDSGKNKVRFDKEKAFFVKEYKDILKNGDMYYNPHFTYLYENYGYK